MATQVYLAWNGSFPPCISLRANSLTQLPRHNTKTWRGGEKFRPQSSLTILKVEIPSCCQGMFFMQPFLDIQIPTFSLKHMPPPSCKEVLTFLGSLHTSQTGAISRHTIPSERQVWKCKTQNQRIVSLQRQAVGISGPLWVALWERGRIFSQEGTETHEY